MDETNRTNPGVVLLAFLAGAVTGALVALLTAPQSGRETRSRLKELARDAAGKAPHLPEALSDAYARASRAARQAFNETLEERASSGGPRLGAGGH